MSTLSKKMATRLKQDHGLAVIPELRRTYAGRVQKQHGAFTWWMFLESGTAKTVGGQYPASMLIKCEKWDVSENDLDNGSFIVDPSYDDIIKFRQEQK